MKKYTELDETPTFSIPVTKRKLKQMEIAKELNISKSYLSMILSGQRKCPVELVETLQAIPGVHKGVNLQSSIVPSKQRVEGSNPSRDSTKLARQDQLLLQESQPCCPHRTIRRPPPPPAWQLS
jgi:transcriptional regulator with XRE-family HTH domain